MSKDYYRFDIKELEHEGKEVEGKVDINRSDGIGGKETLVGIYSFHCEPGVDGLTCEWSDKDDDGSYHDDLRNFLWIYMAALRGQKFYWDTDVNRKVNLQK